jgi:hypothetical protein
MRYTMKRRVLGAPDYIDISKDEFTQWKSAQRNLFSVLNIEVTFDLLLENYTEFERDCLGLSHRFLLFRRHGEPLGPKREINRRMANLLSSARLYVEQVPQDLDAIYRPSKRPDTRPSKRSTRADSEPAKAFIHACNQQRTSFAYCAMHALRDYAQHWGIPIHEVLYHFTRDNMHPGSPYRVGLQIFVDVNRLALDPLFDQGVLRKLERKANSYGCVEVTPWVSEYMEKLCTIHEALRAQIAADVASWDQTIIRVLDRARASLGDDLSGLAVVAEEEHDDVEYLDVAFADIVAEPIEWRQQLEAKNQGFDNLSAGYVMGYVRRPSQP